MGDVVPLVGPVLPFDRRKLTRALMPLTPHEVDLLRLLAEVRGPRNSNEHIGQELGIAPGTVKGLMGVICLKLGAKDRTHAVVRAMQLGILPCEPIQARGVEGALSCLGLAAPPGTPPGTGA